LKGLFYQSQIRFTSALSHPPQGAQHSFNGSRAHPSNISPAPTARITGEKGRAKQESPDMKIVDGTPKYPEHDHAFS